MREHQLIKNILFSVAVICMLTCISTIGFAATVPELREAVQTVREKLVVLLVTTDKDKQTMRIKDIRQLSQDIDAKVKALLEDKETSEDVKKKLAEFQSVWSAFRTTRDAEIIPLILSDDVEKIKEGKRIARTIQAERFQKMQSLLQ